MLGGERSRSELFEQAARGAIAPARVTRWLDAYDRVASFVTEHGRLPREGAHRDENSLAQWLRRNRNTPAGLCGFQRRQLAALGVLPESPREMAWESAFFDAADLLETGTRPSRLSPNPRERSIAVWIHDNRLRYHRDRLPAERRAQFAQLLPLLDRRADLAGAAHRGDERKEPQ